MNFTYEAYSALISAIAKKGYSFDSYQAYTVSGKSCILRHDVDIDLLKAVKLAELESSLLYNDRGGYIRSTYFVLVTSDFYNIHSRRSRSLLGQIKEFGHHIGLHFDETAYKIGNDKEMLVKKILEERQVLSDIIADEVVAVSMHRPSSHLLEMNLEIPSMINSYSNCFFHDFKYVSDSRMHWREDVLSIVESGQYDKLHILTHPFWYDLEEKPLRMKLMEFLCEGNGDRYDVLNHNFKDLGLEVKRDEIE